MLNVGFGLGLIDQAIQDLKTEKNVTQHTIIEVRSLISFVLCLTLAASRRFS